MKKNLLFISLICFSLSSNADTQNTELAKKEIQSKNYEKALVYAKKALKNDELENKSDRNITIAIDYNNIAYIYVKLKKYDQALDFYNKTLEIKKKIYKKESKSLTITYNNIAQLYENKKDYKNALKYYQKALNAYETLLDKDHAYRIFTLKDISRMYEYLDKPFQAAKNYKEALMIQERILPKTHPDLYEAYLKMANLSERTEALNDALVYYEKAKKLHLYLYKDDKKHLEKLNQKIDYLNKKVLK